MFITILLLLKCLYKIKLQVKKLKLLIYLVNNSVRNKIVFIKLKEGDVVINSLYKL